MSDKDVELRELVLSLLKVLHDCALDEYEEKQYAELGKKAEKLFEETQVIE